MFSFQEVQCLTTQVNNASIPVVGLDGGGELFDDLRLTEE
jgi:hypothetical protein